MSCANSRIAGPARCCNARARSVRSRSTARVASNTDRHAARVRGALLALGFRAKGTSPLPSVSLESACQPMNRSGDNSCSIASTATVVRSPLPPRTNCVKPATCVGSRCGCAFWLDVVRSLCNVSKAAARTVVRAVGRQTRPSLGLTASSSAPPISIVSTLAPAVSVSVAVGFKVT